MKKLLLSLATVSTVLLTSCTSSDSIEYTQKSNPSITAERIPGIVSALPDTWELVITGNVLNNIKINTSQEDAIKYSSGRIIEIQHFTNASLSSFDEFTYNSNGKVASITSKNTSNVVTASRAFNYSNPNLIEEVVSTYNTNGSIASTYTVYKNIVNGNLVEYNIGTNELATITYDTKQNVFSDLQCLNELVLYYSNEKVGKNNRILSTSNFMYNGSLLNTTSRNYTNQYDSNNKIVKSTLTSNNESYIIKHTY